MGGLGPGIGGLEYLVIGIVALVVVGPERLPGMLRQLGKLVAKARGMANEFRSSFDEMARQSELDDLRKEVQAMRDGQGSIGQGMVRLGDEANAAFKDIKAELENPVSAPAIAPPVVLDRPEFPEPVTEAAVPPKVRKPRAAPAKPKTAKASAPAKAKAPAKAETPRTVKPRAPRKPKPAQ